MQKGKWLQSVSFFLILLVLAAQGNAQEANKTSAEKLLGAWKLISLYIENSSGVKTHIYGENPRGYLLYTSDGYMAAILLSGDRPRFQSNDILGGTAEEKVSAADSFGAYAGTYEVVENTVTHQIKVCFFPNWEGVDQVRFFEFKGGKLLLSTPLLMIDGEQQRGFVEWERP